MPSDEAPNGLQDLLDRVDGASQDTARVRLGDLMAALGERGFGPVLLLAALGMMLPVGMLPGAPVAIGLLMVVAGWQLMRGRKGLRLPNWLARREIPARYIRASLSRLQPFVRRNRSHLHEHAPRLTERRVILLSGAVTVMLCGALIMALGIVPGLPAALAVPVALFGLGLTIRNGILAILGLAILVPGLIGAAWMMPWPPWSFLN